MSTYLGDGEEHNPEAHVAVTMRHHRQRALQLLEGEVRDPVLVGGGSVSVGKLMGYLWGGVRGLR